MLLDQKRYEAALAASTQELALVALRLGGSHHALAVALDGRAGALSGQCKTRDALEPQQKACSILEEELGAPHPQLALCLGNLAGLYAKLGDHARALPIKRRALSMFNLLPGHPNHVGMAHRNLVRSLVALGQTDEAQAELGAALPLSESSPAQVAVTVLRGEIRQRKGETSKAREDFTRAVEMARNAGPSRRLEPLMLLAQANLDLGRLAEAEAAAREAVAATRSSYGEGACQTAEPLGLLAEALLESGRAEQALPVAEGAVAALAEAQLDSRIRAHAEFTIARALPPEGRERAHRLANSALRAARQAPAEEAFAARVERWLALDLAAAAK